MSSRILVVEDNEMNMQLFEYLLEESGFEIVKATSGEEALRLAGEASPDLILMDIHLPGMDGLSVVRELKSGGKLSGVPILALTAHAMRGDREHLLFSSGANDYVAKPIADQQGLVDLLRRHIDASGSLG